MADARPAASPPKPGPSPGPDGGRDQLPPALATALAAFERSLRSERSLSPHTVRAYAGDVRSLLGHARDQGVQGPPELGVAVRRGWLAGAHEAGAARAPLARDRSWAR